MAGRPIAMSKGPSVPFRFPNLASLFFRPGRQPYNPGESQMDSGGPAFNLIPWPNAVPSLVALANNPGIARERGLAIVNNSVSSLPENFLFIGGVIGKSRG